MLSWRLIINLYSLYKRFKNKPVNEIDNIVDSIFSKKEFILMHIETGEYVKNFLYNETTGEIHLISFVDNEDQAKTFDISILFISKKLYEKHKLFPCQLNQNN